MYAIKYGLTLFAFLLIMSCGGAKTASQMFEIQITEKNKGFRNGSDIALQLKNKEGVEIKSISYSIDGVEQNYTNGSLALNVERLGNKTLKASITHEEGESVVVFIVVGSIERELHVHDISLTPASWRGASNRG
jgi:hypothetical protein